MNDAVLVIDSDGQIMLVNEAILRLTGASFSELYGQTLAKLPRKFLVRLGYTKQEAETLIYTDHGNQIINTSTITIKRSESERILERETFPLWGEKEKVTGWLILFHEVTQEQQVSQAREFFTDTLVHDLRSPVSAIVGALDLIGETLVSDYPSKESIIYQALQVARRGSQRLLGLIDSLLDIARLQSRKLEIIPTTVNLRTLSARVVSDFIDQAQEYGVTFQNKIQEDTLPVCADLKITQRIFANLLDNALKFTPRGGQIILSTERIGSDKVLVKISDTGPGVPEEYREKIFERFTQVPGLRGRRRGSGLGLTFCRLALEAQGGAIWVEPRKGGGSVFIFSLPAMRDQKSAN